MGEGCATQGDCPLLPCLSLLPAPVPTSPQFTNSLSLGLFHVSQSLEPTNHAHKRCPGGRRDWRFRGAVPVGSARGEPGRAARQPCSSPATPSSTRLHRETRPRAPGILAMETLHDETRVARLLGCCEPTKIARGGGAPGRRRSPALPGSRGRGAAAGDTPLRAAPREARTLRRQKSCPPHAEPPQLGILPAPGRPLALS